MTLLLYLLFLPLFSTIVSAFPCNSNAYVPTKIALYNDRSVVLECAYPNCQQDNVTFIQQTYPRSFTTRQQGYEYNIEILDCSYTFGLICPGGTVDANEPNLPFNEKLCCKNIHSNYTLENVVILNTNQEVAGGAVTSNGRIIGYDYISAVNKLSTNGGDVYQVQTRRLNCLAHETNNTKQASKARAHAEPNYGYYYTTTTAGYYGGYQGGNGYGAGGNGYGAGGNGYGAGGNGYGAGGNGYGAGGNGYGAGGAPAYYPVGAGGGGASSLLQNFCFSDDMEIDTVDGAKKMVDLEMGDWVKAYSTYNKYDPVSSFLHRLPEQEAEFIQFNLTNDKILKITPNHLIYKVDCDREYSDEDIDKLKAVPSQAIHPNDCLLSWSEDDKLVPTHINSISTIKQKGIFAPLTTSGNIVVNGVYTSCHSVSENYSLLKGTTQLMQKLNGLLNYLSWSTEENSINEIDIPFSTQILYEMSRIVVPDQKLFF